ncbi:hypothetical protein [Rhizobium leguminosarum]|uniref:hypothetical protein n=1 Tax=Rhizobium leguminosarum TaxID=384 RepID=UPI003F976606
MDASAELVKHLVSDGYNIVIPFYQNSAAANRIVSEIEAQGGTAVALFADLENHEHVAAVLRTANPAMPAVIGGELRNRSQLTCNSL